MGYIIGTLIVLGIVGVALYKRSKKARAAADAAAGVIRGGGGGPSKS